MNLELSWIKKTLCTKKSHQHILQVTTNHIMFKRVSKPSVRYKPQSAMTLRRVIFYQLINNTHHPTHLNHRQLTNQNYSTYNKPKITLDSKIYRSQRRVLQKKDHEHWSLTLPQAWPNVHTRRQHFWDLWRLHHSMWGSVGFSRRLLSEPGQRHRCKASPWGLSS